jgi:hypothetical protein
MKLYKSAEGKQMLKLSKTEWENIGTSNGWLKKEAQITPGATPESQKLAQTLNYYQGLMTLPDNQQQFRVLASQLIQAFDADLAESAGNQATKPYSDGPELDQNGNPITPNATPVR